MAEDRLYRIQKLLQNFTGPEPLKRLFWEELNYDRENEDLSTRKWSDAAKDAISGNPVLWASGGSKRQFHIIYCQLKGRLLRVPQRDVIGQLLIHHDSPNALYVFSDYDQVNWHLVNVKWDTEQERRKLYRRITIGPNEQLRTATERIAMLDLEEIENETGQRDMNGLSPLAIQTRHDEAFDVEAVTKKFFQEYARVFAQVEGLITGIKDQEQKRLYTQRLFNRLMFIAFIQKKGWLKFDGSADYMNALWDDYKAKRQDGDNFYAQRLKLLFFHGLNNKSERDFRIKDGTPLGKIIGTVPYLNGGLFDEEEDDRNEAIKIPDRAFKLILNSLFNKFNFTVTESTPLDVEVAVDPEMLGKVFEELVTGRHETGSYYTPKQVVSFMCKEALKGYLGAFADGETDKGLETFIEQQKPKDLKSPERVLDALRGVRVCDPACGSGAYLLGMLHELLNLRECLFRVKDIDPISTYERKLEIIQKSLYGVDLDPFAMNIARLRLWLSLAVEYEGNNPPPLPNLDFKIECGDSLTAPNPEEAKTTTVNQRIHLIKEFVVVKDEYLHSHGNDKKSLKAKAEKIKEQIRKWSGQQTDGFDWPIEFAEVFMDGGFHIIVANPPYVRADAQFKHIENDEPRRQAEIAQWKAYRDRLKKSKIYETLYEKWDLYIPFLERAHQILALNGQMVFIIPDAYNAAKYTKKSHELFIGKSRINRIDFCSEIPLFSAGVFNTILHYTKQIPAPKHEVMRIERKGEGADDFDKYTEDLGPLNQADSGEQLFRREKPSTMIPKGTCDELGTICFVSAGMVINAHEKNHSGEFTGEDLLSEIPDKKHPKRFVFGKDFLKWSIRNERYLEWGTKRAPAHFRRKTFPELQDAQVKLLTVRTPGRIPKTILDSDTLYYDASSVGFVPWYSLKGVRNRSIHKSRLYEDESPQADETKSRNECEKISEKYEPRFLLAIMNSSFTAKWLADVRRSRLHVYPDDWKKLPIPAVSKAKQKPLVKLVDSILSLYQRLGHPLPEDAHADLEDLEKEIDAKVWELYGLNPNDYT